MAKKAGRKRDGNGASGSGTSSSEHANKSKKVKSCEKSTSGFGDDGFNRLHGGAPFTTLKNSHVEFIFAARHRVNRVSDFLYYYYYVVVVVVFVNSSEDVPTSCSTFATDVAVF